MASRDVLGGRFDMSSLVIKEDVGLERLQELTLVHSAQKQCLVDADVPGTQGADNALMRRGTASGDERGAYRRLLGRELGLDAMQRSKEGLKRAARQRFGRTAFLGAVEFIQTTQLVHP